MTLWRYVSYQGVWVMLSCWEVKLVGIYSPKSYAEYIRRDVLGVRALGKSKCHSDTDNQDYTTGSV